MLRFQFWNSLDCFGAQITLNLPYGRYHKKPSKACQR